MFFYSFYLTRLKIQEKVCEFRFFIVILRPKK